MRQDAIDKIGNALIYLSSKITNLSKTKALKALYLLDHISISNSGIPFFNLEYKIWKHGPVPEYVYKELSKDNGVFSKYISTEYIADKNISILKPIRKFNDDEFSDADIKLLKTLTSYIKRKKLEDIIELTHHKDFPWYKQLEKSQWFDKIKQGKTSKTNIPIDFSLLVEKDPLKKSLYHQYKELFD